MSLSDLKGKKHGICVSGGLDSKTVTKKNRWNNIVISLVFFLSAKYILYNVDVLNGSLL